MKQVEPREGYNRLDPVPMTVIKNDPPADTRRKEFQLKVYEGDSVELIGSCEFRYCYPAPQSLFREHSFTNLFVLLRDDLRAIIRR